MKEDPGASKREALGEHARSLDEYGIKVEQRQPSTNMALSTADMSRIRDYLTIKWSKSACPMCGGRQWQVIPEVFELRPIGKPASDEDKQGVLPLVGVICNGCGMSLTLSSKFVDAASKEMSSARALIGSDFRVGDRGETRD